LRNAEAVLQLIEASSDQGSIVLRILMTPAPDAGGDTSGGGPVVVEGDGMIEHELVLSVL
jgi:hypothetical protein